MQGFTDDHPTSCTTILRKLLSDTEIVIIVDLARERNKLTIRYTAKVSLALEITILLGLVRVTQF